LQQNLPDILALVRDERVDAKMRHDVTRSLATLQDREALPDILALFRDKYREDVGSLKADMLNALWRLAQAEKIPIRF
jgi:HEAT repeat protein